jgi:NADH:ubiquinone oxidoreductase subunit 6 (subunit J)
MLILLLAVVATIFAIGAIRAKRMLVSSIWLAGVSAIVSIIFYLYGARQVAVIELSVGSGLVTVLFVFAISIAGDDPVSQKPILPKPFFIVALVLFVLLLGWYLLPGSVKPVLPINYEAPLTDILWQQRGLDVLVQVVLIFSGVLGLLGLLAETKAPLEGSLAEEVAGQRDRELQELEGQILGEGGELK